MAVIFLSGFLPESTVFDPHVRKDSDFNICILFHYIDADNVFLVNIFYLQGTSSSVALIKSGPKIRIYMGIDFIFLGC